MPTKYKPSNWQPSGIEILEGFGVLYDSARLDRILEAGPKFITPEKETELRKRIFYTALELFNSRKQSGRPSIPEKRAALGRLRSETRNLSQTLRSLDHDTERGIWESAGPDGDVHLSEVRRQLVRLYRWVLKTERRVGPPLSGRPLDTALRSAVDELHTAWDEAAGELPTHSPFMSFVELALRPVAGSVDFEGPCREVLYGEKAGKRHPH